MPDPEEVLEHIREREERALTRKAISSIWVAGRCPGCNSDGTLFVASGGYITCSMGGCPNPGAVSELLDGASEDRFDMNSDHMKVLLRANRVYESKNRAYSDVWKNYGWRGCLMHLRTCVERAWNSLYSAPPGATVRVDNLIDAINYAAFAVRNMDEGNRDGIWGYPEK